MTEGTQQPPNTPGGYGYPHDPHAAPQAHPGHAWTPPSDGLGHIMPQPRPPQSHAQPQQPQGAGAEPDWTALAQRTETAGRKRKLLLAGGGVLAAAVVAGIVISAVVLTNEHNKQVISGNGASTPSVPAQPTPTFSKVTLPPAPDPVTVLSDPKRDTAPLTADGLFYGTKLTMNGRTYTRVTTDSPASCSAAAHGTLATDLDNNGCQEVLRATYQRDGMEVTVGVAVFGSKSAADNAKSQDSGYIEPLGSFCHGAVCDMTANAVGRYAYFTVAGYANGSPVASGDTAAQAESDIRAYAFSRLIQRGHDEAATATS